MGEGGLSQVLDSGVDFAGYCIEALLGRGGMSEVYRASNPRLGNSIAIKLLARELADDQVFQERFMRESRLAASLNHPNVVPIFDAGEADGLPYIAMRYVDGPDLKQLLAREGPLPLEYAVAILSQVGAALDTAHDAGLIHRDVKPGNILIDEKSGTDGIPHVYLSDFGVAKHSQSRSGLTSTGHFVGTIDYIAPEQIEGKPLDGTTDIYSLGCLFYECLTGVPPFDRDTDVALIYAHLVEPPPPVSAKRGDIPPALDGVIGKALSKRPEDRYRTCRELLSAARATYGADTAGFPAGQPTAAAPVAGGTVLAPSTNGGEAPPTTLSDEPPAGVTAPPTTLSDEPPAAVSAPPTAFAGADAPGSTTPVPPTEIAGGGGSLPLPPAGVAPGGDGSDGPTDEQQTRHGEAVSRHRAWPRALVVGIAVLLLAGGAAAAVLITSSGKSTKNHQTTGGTAGSATDVSGGAVNTNVGGASTGSSSTTKTKTQAQQSTKSATTKTKTTTTSNRRRGAGQTTTTQGNRRRGTTSQTTTTQGNRRRGTTSQTTTSSSTNRRRGASSGSSSGTTTDRRRR